MKEDMEHLDTRDLTWSLMQQKFQKGSIAMALKGGRIAEKWGEWRQ